jgi:hypothetical protein
MVTLREGCLGPCHAPFSGPCSLLFDALARAASSASVSVDAEPFRDLDPK